MGQVKLGKRVPFVRAAALLAAVCAVVYWNSLEAPFLLDNQAIILKDARLQSADWAHVREIFAHQYWWGTTDSLLYRPVTTLSYWFNFSVLGGGAVVKGYHVVNVLLHWGVALLMFGLVQSVTSRQGVALAASVLFAVHPLTVESVTNVVGRADVLAALAVLGGVLLHRRFVARGARHSWSHGVRLAVVFAVGVLCKESAVVTPALVLLHDIAFPDAADTMSARVRQSVLRRWPSYAAMLPGLLMLAGVRWALFHSTPLFGELAVDNPIAIATPIVALMTVAKTIGYYLALVVWPVRLSCDYSFSAVTLFGGTLTSGQDLHAWMGLSVVLGLVVGAWLAWKRARGVSFFMGVAAVAWLPTSNLFVTVGAIMAERFMYLPLVGLLAAAITAVAAAFDRDRQVREKMAVRPPWVRTAVFFVFVGVAAALGARTIDRNADWSSEGRLYASSLQAAPDSLKLIRWEARAAFMANPGEAAADRALTMMKCDGTIDAQAALPLAQRSSVYYSDCAGYYLLKARIASGIPTQEMDAIRHALPMLERAAEVDRAFNDASRQRRLARGADPASIRDVGTPLIYRNLAMVYARLGAEGKAADALAYARRLDSAPGT